MSFKIISVDEKKCVSCKICEIVCSLKKEGNLNPTRSRIRVYSLYPRVDVPVVCRQCNDLPCRDACEYDAISRNKENNSIIIDSTNCIGCGLCIEACPFQAIFLHPETNKAVTCDLCEGDPVCVKYCPTKAITYVPWEESLEAKRGSEKKLYQDLNLFVLIKEV